MICEDCGVGYLRVQLLDDLTLGCCCAQSTGIEWRSTFEWAWTCSTTTCTLLACDIDRTRMPSPADAPLTCVSKNIFDFAFVLYAVNPIPSSLCKSVGISALYGGYGYSPMVPLPNMINQLLVNHERVVVVI